MRSRFPGVSLLLQDLTSEEQVEALKVNRIDVGLVRPPVLDAESLVMQVIWREDLMVQDVCGSFCGTWIISKWARVAGVTKTLYIRKKRSERKLTESENHSHCGRRKRWNM